MTIHREWQHGTTLGDSNGTCIGSGVTVSGDVVITGGGWAELIKHDYSNESSTDTTGNTAMLWVPLVAMWPIYHAGSNTTTLRLKFGVPPGARIRSHVLTVWED